MSVTLDFVQEHRAGRAAERCRRSVALRARVWRDGVPREIPADRARARRRRELSAGDLVPADGRLLEARDLFVNQALAHRRGLSGREAAAASGGRGPPTPRGRAHAVFMGTSVVSGTGAAAGLRAPAPRTALGQIAAVARREPPPTAFERGTRRFGLLIMRLTIAARAVRAAGQRALPPAAARIVPVRGRARGRTHARAAADGRLGHAGARRPADGARARSSSSASPRSTTSAAWTCSAPTRPARSPRRASGSSSTSTPTAATASACSSWPASTATSRPASQPAGRRHPRARRTSTRRRGARSTRCRSTSSAAASRCCSSGDGQRLLVVKGAFEDVLRLRRSDGRRRRRARAAARRRRRARDSRSASRRSAREGFRVLGVAWRRRRRATTIDVGVDDERDLVFAGFAAFDDPPKASAAQALRALAEHGVAVKIVTGDNELVTRHVCARARPRRSTACCTGARDRGRSTTRRCARARRAHQPVLPRRRRRRRTASSGRCKPRGHVVGYLGDGINDAPSLHAADVGLSVDGAVDVAKEAADHDPARARPRRAARRRARGPPHASATS